MLIKKIEEREYNVKTNKWDGTIDCLILSFVKHNKEIGFVQIDITKENFITNNFKLEHFGFEKFLKYIKEYILEFNKKYNKKYNKIIFTSNGYYKGVDFSLLKKDGENYIYEI